LVAEPYLCCLPSGLLAGSLVFFILGSVVSGDNVVVVILESFFIGCAAMKGRFDALCDFYNYGAKACAGYEDFLVIGDLTEGA